MNQRSSPRKLNHTLSGCKIKYNTALTWLNLSKKGLAFASIPTDQDNFDINVEFK